MMRFFWIATFLMVLCLKMTEGRAFVLDDVKLVEMSSSHLSVVIDHGILENYKEGSTGKFFIQGGKPQSPKIFLVAEGRCIKSFPNKSIWYLAKIYVPRFIKPNARLLGLISTKINSGRNLTVKRRQVVLSPGDYRSVDQYLLENKNNVPDRLISDLNKHEKSDQLFDLKKEREADLVVETYTGMKKKSSVEFSDHYNEEVEEKYFVKDQEVKLANLALAEDEILLDSIADGIVDKTNSEKYPLMNGLYREQEKDGVIRDLGTKITVSSVYDQVKENTKLKEHINPLAQARIERHGLMWSQEMDDETLRRYFIRTGLMQEELRRERALNELDSNEMILLYAGSLVEHSTDTGSGPRSLGSSWGIGYDLHLSRTSKSLKDWSVQFILEKGTDNYNISGMNRKADEKYYGVYLNYYFFNKPYILHSLILLGGIGIKAGTTTTTGEDGAGLDVYRGLALPAYQLLAKYRFRAGDLNEDTVNIGAGFNAGIQLNQKILRLSESETGQLEGKATVSDLKYVMGMSFYF